jgi:hypothetical protein
MWCLNLGSCLQQSQRSVIKGPTWPIINTAAVTSKDIYEGLWWLSLSFFPGRVILKRTTSCNGPMPTCSVSDPNSKRVHSEVDGVGKRCEGSLAVCYSYIHSTSEINESTWSPSLDSNGVLENYRLSFLCHDF